MINYNALRNKGETFLKGFTFATNNNRTLKQIPEKKVYLQIFHKLIRFNKL